jgi:hypothetical protein
MADAIRFHVVLSVTRGGEYMTWSWNGEAAHEEYAIEKAKENALENGYAPSGEASVYLD